MSGNLQKNRKLLLITDTSMYRDKDGSIHAFGPVVRELEFISNNFEKITWIGYNRPDLLNNKTMDQITANNIELRAVGGDSTYKKFGAFLYSPIIFYHILLNIFKNNIIHTRGPSLPALIAINLSKLFKRKVWWNKYAGDWNQRNAPFFYKLQVNKLKKLTNTKVTINGFWQNQPSHCLSFENPCLTLDQIDSGCIVANQKSFYKPFRFVFVGRLEDEKGVQRIINAFRHVDLNLVESVDFIGDGPKFEHYKKDANYLKNKVKFHGFLNSSDVHQILRFAHFLLLPSTASEGFPKVIAEAACYGTIPIVSNVGSIGHYINEINGFVCDLDLIDKQFNQVISELDACSSELLKNKSTKILELAKLFTFERCCFCCF